MTETEPDPDPRHIDELIVAGYEAQPQDDEDEELAAASLRALLDEEPW